MYDTTMGTRTSMDWTSFNWFGMYFLLLGIVWLGDNMGWWNFEWSMVGPISLIFAGAMVFLSRRK